MLTTLDRYILRGLIVNYLIAIGVMISLYIVLDMFINLDEFTENATETHSVLPDIISYYGNRVFQYFAQLSGVITLFACMLTLSRMRRINEMTAILAGGVSLYRVAATVIGFGLATTTMWYIDSEYIIPSIAHKLARDHDDAQGTKTFKLRFLLDSDGSLMSAHRYDPQTEELHRLLILKRDADGRLNNIIQADRATWFPDKPGSQRGVWKLERGFEIARPTESEAAFDPGDDIRRHIIDQVASDLSPQAIEMRQSAGWINFLSSSRLDELGERLDPASQGRIRHAKHVRFTTPIVNLLMLVLGLPFVLTRVPANVLGSVLKLLLVCGSCFLFTFISQTFGKNGTPLPAWMPIMVFTPIAVILFDRLKS